MRRKDLARKIRVLIVDDDPVVRRGIHFLIAGQPDMVVCGETEDAPDALAKVVELRPEVATVDLNLGSESGLELIRRMRALGSAPRILVLSFHEERPYVDGAAAAGADAYVTKGAATQSLVGAIRQLMLPRNLRASPSEPCVISSS